MNYASIALHLDSLSEAYGFPPGYDDPTFTEIAGRFFKFSDRYDFKYSIFIITRDLEQPERREAVQRWQQWGHEIGNHSYSHRYDLGAAGEKAMLEEVTRSHDLLVQTCGVAPRGFVAPAWSSSAKLSRILENFGYRYNASILPSWIRYAAMAKTAQNFWGTRRVLYCVNQRDVFKPLMGSRQAYTTKRGLFEIPVPTGNFRLACWHTVAFVFGWAAHERILRQALDTVEAFHYVVHPADLLSPELLKKDQPLNLARVDVPLATKMKYLEQSLEIIVKSGRKLVTMEQLTSLLNPRVALSPATPQPHAHSR